MTTPLPTRPYRSHKVPACDICRKRKIHCNVDIASQPCRYCRERGLECQSSNIKHKDGYEVSTNRPQKRTRITSEKGQSARSTDHVAAPQRNVDHFTSPTESASVLLNPTMAEDVDVLEHYFTSHTHTDASIAKSYSRVAHARGEPIRYLSVPRWRKGLRIANDPGRAQREIMEQVLGSFKQGVLEL